MIMTIQVISEWGKLAQVQTHKDNCFGSLIKLCKFVGGIELVH